MSHPFFTGHRLVIASMYGKEKVAAPGLENGPGLDILVSFHLNTDFLGTSMRNDFQIMRLENAKRRARSRLDPVS